MPEDPFDADLTIAASAARRLLAVAALGGLGGLLLWLGLGAEGETDRGTIGRIALVLMGALALAGAEALRRATGRALRLDRSGLSDSDGTILARWDQIARVDRGAFAVKPSNGFLLHLTEPAPRAWAPGMWWRVGRRVGVGGVLNAGATRAMAEQITLRLALSRGEI